MQNLNLENLPKVGSIFLFNHRGASFNMKVMNARIRYGNIDVLVSPVDGDGSFWVKYDNATVLTPTETPVIA